MQEIVQKPTALFQLMGQKFPFVGGYFITVVVSMATFGTAWGSRGRSRCSAPSSSSRSSARAASARAGSPRSSAGG